MFNFPPSNWKLFLALTDAVSIKIEGPLESNPPFIVALTNCFHSVHFSDFSKCGFSECE